MRVPAGLNRLQYLVAGQVLEQLKDNPGFDSLSVEGVRIDDPAAAIAAYQDSLKTSPVFEPVDKLVAKLAAKDDGLDAEQRAFKEDVRPFAGARKALKSVTHFFERTLRLDKLKKPFEKVAGFDSQPVRCTAQVEVRMKSGASVTLPEELVDTGSTLTLKRLGLLADATALNPIPFVGSIGPALLGVTELTSAAVVGSLAGLASLGLVPKHVTSGAPLAGALARAGVKQLVVAVAGGIPGVSEMTVPVALYADAKQIAEMKASS